MSLEMHDQNLIDISTIASWQKDKDGKKEERHRWRGRKKRTLEQWVLAVCWVVFSDGSRSFWLRRDDEEESGPPTSLQMPVSTIYNANWSNSHFRVKSKLIFSLKHVCCFLFFYFCLLRLKKRGSSWVNAWMLTDGAKANKGQLRVQTELLFT